MAIPFFRHFTKVYRDPPYGRQERQEVPIKAWRSIEDLSPLALETPLGGWA